MNLEYAVGLVLSLLLGYLVYGSSAPRTTAARGPSPPNWVTALASGLDPHLSPEAALW